MSISKKIRVGVLRGGPSDEYDVSLKTGESVLSNLPERYEPIDILIGKNGEWHHRGVVREPADIIPIVDVIFNALHGHYGEDGKVQKILDHFGVPYTGSGALASSVAMNKHLTKQALSDVGVKMAYHKLLRADEMEEIELHDLFKMIPHPSVIKPASSGSSVGVGIVRTFFDLGKALENAFALDENVIVEEFIDGREATCGVVDDFRDEDLYALPPIEIIARGKDFFDYEAKYGGGSEEICPGNFDEKTKRAIQEAARIVHDSLNLRHYSRSDFRIHPKRGVYFLEVNTLPGLTGESLLPKSLAAVGTPLSHFLDHVITLARS